MPVVAWTALANGESQTSAQCPPPPIPHTTSPPRRATSSSYHWKPAHAACRRPTPAAIRSARIRVRDAPAVLRDSVNLPPPRPDRA